MTITTTGRKMNVSDALSDYVEKKVSKLEKFFYADATAKCLLSAERGRDIAEITVNHNGMIFRAQEESGDMYASVDKAVSAIESQIKKNKTRIEKRLREGAFDIVEGDAGEVDEHVQEEIYEIARVKRFALKPMDVDEAILQMNILGHEFFLFDNIEENTTCVVYRRSGGGYGLIIPQKK